MTDAPKLLVEWSSPWQEFVSSLGPALGRSPARLAGEAQTGLFPLRGILLSWGLQAIFLAALIWIPARLAGMRPYVPPAPPKYDVIYFSGDELPQTADRGGAPAGKTGRTGGKEAYHRTQTIRVARGNSAVERVVDAPDLKLPVSSAPVANLLAFKPVPGPPPAEGLKRSVAAPTLSKNAIVAPPPEVFRDLDRALPRLGTAVLAPPPANIERNSARATMGLSTAVIAPAPQDVPRDPSRSLVAMTSPIVEPAPTDIRRDPPPLRGPSPSTATVVPPPVSAPLRDSTQAAKLTLPPPAVIAPPPSQVTRDQRSVTGASLADPKVVPPPVQLGGRSRDRQAIVGPVGANQIVPPPPSLTAGTAIAGAGSGHNERAGGLGSSINAGVVPPPPAIASDASQGRREASDPHGSLGGTLGATAVVPPPPSLGSPGGSLSGRDTAGMGSPAVVPPPPNVSGVGGPGSGRGTGSEGGGIGGVLDSGTVLAPPTSAGGSGGAKGIVVSTQPGSAVGVPGNATAGAIAMSPAGGSKNGPGGSGGGAGIGHGNGPGSGLAGEGAGAARTGSGRGSDPNARGGISPYPGLGGAGSGANGQPAVPGVSVQGGNTIVLPSYGSNERAPSLPGRSSAGSTRSELDVTVEGTSRSGGAFNFYGRLKGDKVYTKFIPTEDGSPVAFEFSDPSSALETRGADLTSPLPMRFDLPHGVNRNRVVIACVLDRSGTLRNLRVIAADPEAPTAKILVALSNWKFTPAFRGADPVEVNAILGFNVGTR